MATREELMASKKANTEKLIKELVVFRQVLIKFDMMEDPNNDALFVEIASTIGGFTSSYGKPLTYMGYRQMMDRADQTMIRNFIAEIQHEPVAHMLPML